MIIRIFTVKDVYYRWFDLQEQRMELADNLREFLNGVVERLMDSEEVQRLSQEFGGRHVQFRSLGFRPDFFATTADAVTTECVFLDAAVHQASDTLTAWWARSLKWISLAFFASYSSKMFNAIMFVTFFVCLLRLRNGNELIDLFFLFTSVFLLCSTFTLACHSEKRF